MQLAARADVQALRQAGVDLLAAIRALQRKGRNVLTAFLPSDGGFRPWAHQPEGDACDPGAGTRWYYHAHPGPGAAGEHGHFHLFADARAHAGEAAHTHLVAIGLRSDGLPVRAFTTNRWVTNESWQPAAQVLGHLRAFAPGSPRVLAPVHRWLCALLRLYAPQLEGLLAARDRRVAALLPARPQLFEDRRTQLLSQCRLDLAVQFAWLDAGCAPSPGVVR